MSISPGENLGQYRIIEPLGRGHGNRVQSVPRLTRSVRGKSPAPGIQKRPQLFQIVVNNPSTPPEPKEEAQKQLRQLGAK